jgi:hypothetical protein
VVDQFATTWEGVAPVKTVPRFGGGGQWRRNTSLYLDEGIAVAVVFYLFVLF